MALMGRVVSMEVAQAAADHHVSAGVRLRFGNTVARIVGDGSVREVVLSDGTMLAADLVLVAIGVEPNVAPAVDVGLEAGNRIVVDAMLATADPGISALGDCAAFPDPFGRGMIRLEFIQNTVDHARCIAARLTGDAKPYAAFPWFWGDQGAWKLQIAGYGQGCTTALVKAAGEGFSMF